MRPGEVDAILAAAEKGQPATASESLWGLWLASNGGEVRVDCIVPKSLASFGGFPSLRLLDVAWSMLFCQHYTRFVNEDLDTLVCLLPSSLPPSGDFWVGR